MPHVPASAATPSDVLVIATNIEDVRGFDPAVAHGVATQSLFPAFYQRLVRHDPARPVSEGAFVGELATGWSVSGDGREWRFELARGSRFETGRPVTSSDVVGSFRRAVLLGGQGSVEFGQLGITAATIDSAVSVDGPQAVTVRLPRPYRRELVLGLLAHRTLSIVDTETISRAGKKGAADLFAKSTLGSGPYRLRRWQPNHFMMAERREGVDDRSFPMRRLIVQHFGEPSAAAFALKRGDVDIAFRMPPDTLESVRNAPGVQLIKGPLYALHFVSMNMLRRPFGALSVRQGMKSLMNYGSIPGLTKGFQVATRSPVREVSSRELPPATDVALARSLFRAAGLQDGHAIRLRARDHALAKPILEEFQQNAAAAGIRVGLSYEPVATLVPAWRARDYDLYYGVVGIGPDPDSIMTDLAWTPRSNSYTVSPGYLAGWNDPVATGLVEQARLEASPSRRAAIYGRLEKILAERSPFIILSLEYLVLGATDQVSGIQFDGMVPLWAGARKSAVRESGT